MEPAQLQRAVAAATTTALALGPEIDNAIVLNDSNRLVVRLTPCDTVARVAPIDHHAGHQVSPEREVQLADQLAQTHSPLAGLDPRAEPRIVVRDGFKIAFWSYWEPMQPAAIPPADYTRALERLHAGLRRIDVPTPHAIDRIAAVEQDVASSDITPDLPDTDRAFLADALRELRQAIMSARAPEQLLHGEPHSANVLITKNGPLFIDFENTSRGPVEYDLGWVPKEVSDHYSAADRDLVGEGRGLVLAMITAYRWRRDDQHPSGRKSGVAFLNALRDVPPWPVIDDVTW